MIEAFRNATPEARAQLLEQVITEALVPAGWVIAGYDVRGDLVSGNGAPAPRKAKPDRDGLIRPMGVRGARPGAAHLP